MDENEAATMRDHNGLPVVFLEGRHLVVRPTGGPVVSAVAGDRAVCETWGRWHVSVLSRRGDWLNDYFASETDALKRRLSAQPTQRRATASLASPTQQRCLVNLSDLIQCDGGPRAGSPETLACLHTDLTPRTDPTAGCFQAPGTWRWVDVPRGLECVVCGSGFCAPADIKRAFTRAGYVAAWVDEEMARRKQFHTAEKERER